MTPQIEQIKHSNEFESYRRKHDNKKYTHDLQKKKNESVLPKSNFDTLEAHFLSEQADIGNFC